VGRRDRGGKGGRGGDGGEGGWGDRRIKRNYSGASMKGREIPSSWANLMRDRWLLTKEVTKWLVGTCLEKSGYESGKDRCYVCILVGGGVLKESIIPRNANERIFYEKEKVKGSEGRISLSKRVV